MLRSDGAVECLLAATGRAITGVSHQTNTGSVPCNVFAFRFVKNA